MVGEGGNMAGRYLITGVQLGMLIALPTMEERQQLIDKIERKQYIGCSDKSVEVDAKELMSHSK